MAIRSLSTQLTSLSSGEDFLDLSSRICQRAFGNEAGSGRGFQRLLLTLESENGRPALLLRGKLRVGILAFGVIVFSAPAAMAGRVLV
jgi:hypothetical protein